MVISESTATLIGLFFSGLGLFASARALSATTRNTKLQNLRSIVDYLQQEDIRDARNEICRLESNDILANSEYDEKASKICGAYCTAGLYLKLKMITIDQISMYEQNIIKCYKALSGYIEREFKKEKRDEEDPMWAEFEYLYKEMKKYRLSRLSNQKNTN